MREHKRNQTYTSATATPTGSFRLPSKIEKMGEALLQHQMWCWGCDVRSKAGNLLASYGFERRPSPDPRWHSAYTLYRNSDSALTLWSWGIWMSSQQHGSLFLSRSRFRTRYTVNVELSPQVWWSDDLPYVHAPRSRSEWFNALALLTETVNTMAAYEEWLAARSPADYRLKVIAAWPQFKRYGRDINPSDLATHWQHLSVSIGKECL